MRSWFDHLTPLEQTPLLQERAQAETQLPPNDWILPPAHGDTLQAQLLAAEQAFLASPEPRGLVRVGDCELGMLAGGLPIGGPSIDYDMGFAGFTRQDFRLRDLFLRALEEMPVVGIHHQVPAWRRRTALLLRLAGLPIPYGVDVHLPYFTLLSGSLVRCLLGKTILLVGHKSAALLAHLRSSRYLSAAQVFGPVHQLRVIGSVPTPNRDLGAGQDYEALLATCLASPADAFLLSCGLVAKPLAYSLWKQGRTALDVGFVFDSLCGNTGASIRPALDAFAWEDFCAKAGITPDLPLDAPSHPPSLTTYAEMIALMRSGQRRFTVPATAASGLDLLQFLHENGLWSITERLPHAVTISRLV